MYLVERGAEARRRLEVPEPEHRVVPLLERPMRRSTAVDSQCGQVSGALLVSEQRGYTPTDPEF